MMEKLSSSSKNSVMKRQSNLISRLEKLELEVNSLDDDGRLRQSSTRVLDDISCVSLSSKRQLESHRLTPVSQYSEQNNMIVKNPASEASPPVPTKPAKPSFFLPQGEIKPNLLSKFLQSNRQFAKDTREMSEESVKNFTTVEHINQSMSLLAGPTPAPTLLSRANIQDRFVLSNLQSPEHNVVLSEQEKTFNQFASIQQPSIPMNQTAVLFPVKSIDNQPELTLSSIGELNQFSSSKPITLPEMPMNEPANARVRPKEKHSVPSNNKREDQSIQSLALDLQNSLQNNCSVNKTNTYQTSNSCNLNEQMLQRQFHSEKGTNRVTNETTPNTYCYEDSRHNPLHFDKNQSATAQTVSNTHFSAVPISENQNSGKLASAMSLSTVARTNVSKQFQNPLYPTGVHFSNGNRTEEPNDGIVFTSNTTLNNQGTNLVCCTSSQPPNCPLTPENPFTNYQKAILPPLLNILANQTFREIRNKFQIGLFLESNCFSHELKYKQKQSRLKIILI